MYELGDPFGEAVVETGTNLLISGPPMTGKRGIAIDILATGAKQGEGTIIVTTKEGASQIEDEFFGRLDDEPQLGIIDGVTRQQGMEDPEETNLRRYTSSPVDLTGIGIELSELLEYFHQNQDITANRVLLDSLSTLLMYSNLQTVFRFLHVFTGRIQSANALGLYTIDDSAHDDQTMSTIQQLFDGAIEIRKTDGKPQYRIVGLADIESEWNDL
ncbi:MAG: RAD55 family ATPase [Halobacteriaceae archaeon]